MTKSTVCGLLTFLVFLGTPVPGFGQEGSESWTYPVRVDGALALIDATGTLVSDRRFEAVEPFAGVGSARSDGRWGFVDARGNWIVEPRWLEADRPIGHYARVRSEAGWILVNREGERVSESAYLDLTPLAQGVASFRPEGSEQWGIVSQTGRELTPPVFDGAGLHAEGRVPVQRFRKFLFFKLERKWGFADTLGAWVVEPVYTSVRSFSDGLALVSDGSGRASYITPDGGEILGVEYPQATSFVEGRARIGREGSWGFMDIQGTVVIPMVFEAAGDFSGGLAAVRSGGLWGYLDTAGNQMIPFSFQVAGSFQGPLARVMRDGVETWINRKGVAVWPKN